MTQTSFDEAIVFASSLTGLSITVTPGTDWRVELNKKIGATIYIGEDYYPLKGLKSAQPNLVTALLLLDIWTVYRLPRQAPQRLIKRRALEAKLVKTQPEIVPLLQTVDRLEATANLLQVFPNFRSNLAKMYLNWAPKSSQDLPPAQQFLLLVLLLSVDVKEKELPKVITTEVLAAQQKIAKLLPLILQNTEISARNPKINADSVREETRMERLIALLTPEYLKLLMLNTKKGLTTLGKGDAAEEEKSEIDFGSTPGLNETKEQDPENVSEADVQDTERESTESETAEGADLFESAATAPVATLLETPIATNSPQMFDFLEQLQTQELLDDGESAAGTPLEQVKQSQYRARAQNLAPQINRVLDVWRSHLNERDNPHSKLSKHSLPEGEMLDDARLAQIIAETKAGVQRPAAFKHRQRFNRRRIGITNTDYVLIIDRSSSMTPVSTATADAALILMESLAAFMREVKEISKFESDIDVEVRTALIAFDATAQLIKPLSAAIDDKARVALYLRSKNPRGSTNDAAALQTAEKEFGVAANINEKKRKRVIIVISDGHSSDLEAANAVLENLKSKGIEVWGIGIRDDAMRQRYEPFYKRVDQGAQIATALAKIVEVSSRRNKISTSRSA